LKETGGPRPLEEGLESRPFWTTEKTEAQASVVKKTVEKRHTLGEKGEEENSL